MVKIQTWAPFTAKTCNWLKTSYGDALGKLLVFVDQKYQTLENNVTKMQKLD